MTSDPRRALPSVTALLDLPAVRAMLAHTPRGLVVDALRAVLDDARRGVDNTPRTGEGWAAAAAAALAARQRSSLRPVLNATGVVLHTNLGRAPLPAAALAAMASVAAGYANLEYDLDAGGRGSRAVHCTALLRELTGAESALVVNNGAAALLLALDTLAGGREAIVSRGELVEIGGSFRVPSIMAKSGAQLVEVGTTNRTHREDYARAIGPRTGAIVKVHRSNFAIAGFVADVPLGELAALAAGHHVPVINDLGSGLFLSLEAIGLAGEPVAGDAVRDGATLVTMSGDKLLGGPQAGILLGGAEAVERARQNPLARALRVDKLTLAALEATLALYRDPPRAMREIPVLAMLAEPVERLHARARALARSLGNAGIEPEVVDSEGSVGGGAFPTAVLPSAALALAGDAPRLDAHLRAAPLPVVGRIANGRLLLDLRSVPAADDARLEAAVREALA